MQFEWDPAKDAANQKKHGLSFAQASTLFTSGETYLEEADLRHVEPRFRAIGTIALGVAVVIFVERMEGEVIRIVSARYATRNEIVKYQQALEG